MLFLPLHTHDLISFFFLFDIYWKLLFNAGIFYDHFEQNCHNKEICLLFLSCKNNMTPVPPF